MLPVLNYIHNDQCVGGHAAMQYLRQAFLFRRMKYLYSVYKIIFYTINSPCKDSMSQQESHIGYILSHFIYLLLFLLFTDIPKMKLAIEGIPKPFDKNSNQIEIKSDDKVKFSCVVIAVPIAYSINWKRNVRRN